VLVDEEGNIITKDGVKRVSQDPTGQSFPWTQDADPDGPTEGK
jgi:hypothetical protein